MTAYRLGYPGLQELLVILKARGYTIIGPRPGEDALLLDVLTSADDLPRGWRDRQSVGRYALEKTGQGGRFQYTCGPDSWKRFLYPPRATLFRTTAPGISPCPGDGDRPVSLYAFLGMRACDLKALAVMDRVLMSSDYPDPDYGAMRQRLFIIAVNCLAPGGTCFCAAMDAGPEVTAGHDIVLSEVGDPVRPTLIAEPGSPDGAEILQALAGDAAPSEDLARIRRMLAAGADRMKAAAPLRHADTLFDTHFDHPHWQTLETRCLACGNCTLVCPTCFCHAVTDVEMLDEEQTERQRVWDSCFSQAFSYIHGGSIRPRIASRYRQWLCHKLATWPAQFDTLGCVGCGRCRTWCPAGIDMVAEAGILTADATP